jgi:3-hydroxyacyl-CoA dehydrogenase
MEMAAKASGIAERHRHVDLMSLLRTSFENLAMARVSTSAENAKELGYVRMEDTVSMGRETLIADAKAIAIGLAKAGHRPPPRRQIKVVGKSGAATLFQALHNLADAHQISAHDEVIGRHLARILSGGDVPEGARVSEQHLLDLEREAFLSLCGEEKTRARMQHMLTTSKPLRN